MQSGSLFFSQACHLRPLPSFRMGWLFLWLLFFNASPVSGTVVDARGRPVPSAEVELLRTREPGFLPREDSSYLAATGTDGRFTILMSPGRFDLTVRARGFAPLERSALEVYGDLGRFVVERGTAVRVRVSDRDGQPVEGAEVWIVPRDPRDWNAYYRQGPAGISGAEGEVGLPDLPPGRSVSLDVCRSGFLPVAVVVREVTSEPIEAVLERSARISGRVTDPAGAAVEGARVVAWLSGERPDRPESVRPCYRELGSARTNGEGRFILESLPPGWWTVRASAPGWLPADSERRQVRAGESLEGMEIALGRGETVAGRVLSPDGAPLSGAEVQALGGPSAVSGADGTYRLEGVETGERTVEATHPDHEFASRTLEVEPGENRLDLKLERDRRREIRGRVLGPLAEARVLGPSSSWTTTDGSFLLRERDGRPEIWAQAEGYAPAQAEVVVDGSPVSGVEIRLSRGGILQGRLLGLDREGLAGAVVELDLPPLFQRRSGVDPQGSYRITGLPPGTWEVTARTGSRTLKERVEISPEETILDLVFQPVFEVSGRVLDPDGLPVADATVRLFTSGSGGWAYTRSDGSFRIELEEGAYRGFALKAGYLSARLEEPVRVEGGSVEGIELTLGRGTVLRGRILGLEPGDRAREVWAEGPDGAIRLGQPDQEGQYVVVGLVPGEWTVKASFERREAVGRITVEEGQDETFLDLAFSEEEEPGQ